MVLVCFLFGHLWAHDCQCDRCGKRRNESHDLDGCKCSHCGEVLQNWSIRNWSFDGHKYIFEKECIKCGKRTTSKEHVPFGKMILGRPIN
jgi:hypothetical protein